METYTFKGKPIEDIEKWCLENDSVMCIIKWEKRVLGANGRYHIETSVSEMPKKFWDNMRMTDEIGTLVGTRQPKGKIE